MIVHPLGIADLMKTTRPGEEHPAVWDHWYWCRHHQRPEHVGWAMDGCIQVGPFMSEREANYLKGYCNLSQPFTQPLGMAVER